MNIVRAAATAVAFALAASAPANATVYTLVTQNAEGVTANGTIETDGTIGVLWTGNFMEINITLSGFGLDDQTLSNLSTRAFVEGSYLTATATGLFWNYAQGVGAEFSVGSTDQTQFHFYTDRTSLKFHGLEFSRYNNGVTLVGTAATASVPEPATWAMMLIGFGAIGFGMRRQQVTTRATVAA